MKIRIPPPPAEPSRTTASNIRNFASGLLLFGPTDFLAVVFTAGGGTPTSGLTPGATLLPALALAATVALVGVLFIYLPRRMLAAGWVSGYLLMSLFSAGACTLIVDPRSSGNSALAGLVLYTIVFIVAGLTALFSFAARR